MGMTRDFCKKIKDTKGTFHVKMGTIKYRNGMDLTEAEDIKKRWQEYTEELYKKDLHDQDNRLLQQNAAIAPYLGRGVSPHCRPGLEDLSHVEGQTIQVLPNLKRRHDPSKLIL